MREAAYHTVSYPLMLASFLTNKGVISSAQAELELCLLSVSYLNFSDICSISAPQATKDALLLGRYSFYEYAVACWVPHLLAWLSGDKPDGPCVAELEETMGPFLDQHYSNTAPTSSVSKAMHEKLRVLEHLDIYESLAQAVVWSRKQFLVDKNENREVHLLDFPDITDHVRFVLEGVAGAGLTPEASTALERYYGDKWFKCPRIYCRHFYDGFESQEHRDRHLNRHERAYTCTFHGCPMATFGCVSKKDLERHMLENHGISSDAKDFPDVPNPDPGPQQKRPATFQCHFCPKRFSRAYNLRSHLRTHTDERPFVCSVCGKSFARHHDRKSHERLHSGEKPFICRGNLNAGGQWGCGRRFARAAALGRHFRSDAGRICLKPVVDEEMIHRQAAWPTRQRNNGKLQVAAQAPETCNMNSRWMGTTGLPIAATNSEAALGEHPSLKQQIWEMRAAQSTGEQAGSDLPTDPPTLPAALLAQYPELALPD